MLKWLIIVKRLQPSLLCLYYEFQPSLLTTPFPFNFLSMVTLFV